MYCQNLRPYHNHDNAMDTRQPLPSHQHPDPILMRLVVTHHVLSFYVTASVTQHDVSSKTRLLRPALLIQQHIDTAHTQWVFSKKFMLNHWNMSIQWSFKEKQLPEPVPSGYNTCDHFLYNYGNRDSVQCLSDHACVCLGTIPVSW